MYFAYFVLEDPPSLKERDDWRALLEAGSRDWETPQEEEFW